MTNGTRSAKAGRNARRTTAHENSEARPDTAVHVSAPPHSGHDASWVPHEVGARLAARDHQLAPRRSCEEGSGERVVDVGEREVVAADRHRVNGPSRGSACVAMWPV